MENIPGRPRLYTAGPGGFSEQGRLFLYKVLIPMYQNIGYGKRKGFEILNPWKLTSNDFILPVQNLPYGVERRDGWRKLNRVLGGNNSAAIRRCDILAADLNGPAIDDGTASEPGYAAGKGKRVEGFRDDFRLIGDNEGTRFNLQIEEFILESGGKIHENLESLRISLTQFWEEFCAQFQ